MSQYVTGATKIKVKATGQIITAIYAPNRKGNLQYNVNGKFYNDKQFNRLFKVIDCNNDDNVCKSPYYLD